MVIERARPHALPKPWGVEDLRPWSTARRDGNAIGEIWYDRSDKSAAEPSLLLKLLFTSEPLSIQVHPDDAFAHSAGLPGGKTEAWYVLSATPEAKVALGLSRRLTPQQLRAAIDDGSISDLIVWRAVSADDVIFVPAGTIHAIGAGLVIAELQQRNDTTFRLFDYGRKRELHIEKAIAVAATGAAHFQVRPNQLTAQRRLFISRLALCTGADRSPAKLPLASGSGTRDMVSRSQWWCYRRIIRCCHGRGPFRAIRPHRHTRRRQRYDQPRGVYGRRQDFASVAATHTARLHPRRATTDHGGGEFSCSN